MPDIVNLNLRDLLVFLTSAAGMVLWMGWESKTVFNIRNGMPDDYDNGWVRAFYRFIRRMDRLQVYVFNLVASVSVPLVLTVILNTVPTEWFDNAQNYYSYLILILGLFIAQQARYNQKKDQYEDELG